MASSGYYDPHAPVPCTSCIFRKTCVSGDNCLRFHQYVMHGSLEQAEKERLKNIEKKKQQRG